MYYQTINLLEGIAIAIIVVFLIAFVYYFLTFKTMIMGKIEELQTALDDQATKIAAEKEQVVAILTEQNANIAALEEQVANGGSSEALQELINKVKANTDALTKIYVQPGVDDTDSGDNSANANS